MAIDRHIYGEVNSKTGMKRVFTDIRRDVEAARSRPALTELYKRAGYLITLTHAPSWHEKFGRDAKVLQKVGEDEFRKTVRKINRRAAAIGTDAGYDDNALGEAVEYNQGKRKYPGQATSQLAPVSHTESHTLA